MARKRAPHLLAAHRVRRPATIQDIARYLERVGPLYNGRRKLDEIERQMTDIVASAGLGPEAWDSLGVVHDPDCGVHGLDIAAEARGHLVGSDVWYAGLILHKVALSRAALASGNVTAIVDHLLSLGWALNERHTVLTYGRPLENGLRIVPALVAAGPGVAARKKDKAAEWYARAIREARAIWKQNPGLSNSRCAARVIERCNPPLPVGKVRVRHVIASAKPK